MQAISNTPRFGGLQILNNRNQQQYVLYSADNTDYEPGGVYYMTAHIGNSPAVEAISKAMASPKADITHIALDKLISLVLQYVLQHPEGVRGSAFKPNDVLDLDTAEDTDIGFMGNDGEWLAATEEFKVHRVEMEKTLKNAWIDRQLFFYDKHGTVPGKELILQQKQEENRLIVYQDKDRHGYPKVSVTV